MACSGMQEQVSRLLDFVRCHARAVVVLASGGLLPTEFGFPHGTRCLIKLLSVQNGDSGSHNCFVCCSTTLLRM